MKIVLLGRIPKGDKDRESFDDWKIGYRDAIISRIPEAIFLDGDEIRDDKGPELCVGHDLWMIKHADALVVNAEHKIGAGTSQEMVFGKIWKKPLVTIIPRDTHHRRSNLVFDGTLIEDWVHPFIFVASDHYAETVADAAQWLVDLKNGAVASIKGVETFEDRIMQFEKELPEIVKKYHERGW